MDYKIFKLGEEETYCEEHRVNDVIEKYLDDNLASRLLIHFLEMGLIKYSDISSLTNSELSIEKI